MEIIWTILMALGIWEGQHQLTDQGPPPCQGSGCGLGGGGGGAF